MVKHMFSALAIGAALVATVQAQQPTTPGPTTGQADQTAGGQNAGAQGAASQQLDQGIAACLALGNQEEIVLAQFAQSRTQNEKVREFAEMMINDHRQALEKLNQAAPQLASVNLRLNIGGQNAEANQPPTATAQTAGAGSPQTEGDISQQMLALQRAIVEQCIQLTQRELGEKQGAEFDHCYVGQQVVAHTQMLAKLKASEQFAGAELRSFIPEATKTVEMHHQHAKALAKSLMDDAIAQSAQRPDGSRR